MLRAWLLLLPTLCYLKINLVGGVAIVAESVLSLNKYSPPVPIRSSNPLGLSIEFATFPSYMNDVLQTTQCLQNLELAVGAPPPIRIGGTTQDRAVYDPNETLPVRFTLPPGQLVPLTLTFGPRFIELASRLKGATTIGFNRRLADVNNVGLAALAALQKMKNLYAIELGNEPEFWDPKSPEVGGQPWTPKADANSQIRWQQDISQKIKSSGIIQAGVYFSPPQWSVQNLAPLEGKSGHAYPQSACFGSQTSLPDLMDHSKVVSFVKHFQPEVLAAKKVQKPYHFSEVNSATCGGQGISATFGAGLWSMDFLFQSLIQGVDRVYFHQGTIGASPYSYWNQTQVSPTYYGAYFTALALRGATQISTIQTSNTAIAVYALLRCQKVIRLVVYHSGFNDGKAAAVQEPPPEKVRIDRVPSNVRTVRLLRLTAKHSFIGEGGPGAGQVQIGGGYFDNATCKIKVQPKYDTLTASGNSLKFTIRKSEAAKAIFPNNVPLT
ncbi:hypothetical protein MJO29_006462 [Puccinia striiformis f. sp. tritici]|nr:hypothetical protein MJO29_006462 [Puccinia striiformis f. sp. tritici]